MLQNVAQSGNPGRYAVPGGSGGADDARAVAYSAVRCQVSMSVLKHSVLKNVPDLCQSAVALSHVELALLCAYCGPKFEHFSSPPVFILIRSRHTVLTIACCILCFCLITEHEILGPFCL